MFFTGRLAHITGFLSVTLGRRVNAKVWDVQQSFVKNPIKPTRPAVQHALENVSLFT